MIVVGVALLIAAVEIEPPAAVSTATGAIAFLLILGGAFHTIRSARVGSATMPGQGAGGAYGELPPSSHHAGHYGGFTGGGGGGHHG